MKTSWDFRSIEDAKSPAIVEGIAYWRSKCVAQQLPSRAQLDPVEMKTFLTNILLIDVVGNGEFIFRLCGTAISDANGRDITGRRADAETLGESVAAFIDSYHRTIASRAPVLFVGDFWWQKREHALFEQVNLPLSSQAETVNQLLCVIDFERPRLA